MCYEIYEKYINFYSNKAMRRDTNIKKEQVISIIGMLAMGMVLIPQIAHSLYLFEVNSRYHNPWFAWAYAVGVDLAIFIFTIKGWLKTALVYMFITLAHNLMYAFAPQSLWSNVLISSVQSLTLFSFTHLFFKRQDATNSQVVLSETTIKMQHAIDAGVSFEALPFECPQCQECFGTSKQLNGHISAHKAQGAWQPDHYGNWKAENALRSSYVDGEKTFN